MRAKQFVPIVEAQQELFEVNMSPGSLKKLANGIDALVGIEFEMIVPDVGSIDGDEDREYEPDYGRDERAVDIDDIIRFFGAEDDYMGNTNSEYQLDRLRDELQEKFWEWQSEKIDENWSSDEGREYFTKWVKNNVDPDDIADHVDKEEDLFGNRHPDGSDYMEFIEAAWENGFDDDNYQNAYDEFREDKQNEGDFDEEEFLRDIGIRDMSDVASRVSSDIGWPYYDSDYGGGDGEMNLESLADEFSDVIGRKVDYSTGYHSGPRTNYSYTIEPDSSLSGSGDDAGLEFISPPLPIDEALEDVKKIKEWADEKGAYTNRTTGLHMNVSVPGFDQEKLDFVKLTLLLGDKYLLDRFGRSANTYCKSALDIIAEAPNVQDKELLFKKLKDNLETMASKVIHSGRVGKFTSINPKDNRVEFRGPGGDWLGQNFDKIEDTLYRCVVALDAAVDPDKYRKEYLKKLTKMFTPSKGSLEDVFVQYAAGTITREELKNKLKATQSQRKQEKFKAEGLVEIDAYDVENNDWIIEYDNPNGDNRRIFLKRTEAVSDDDQALKAAIKLEPSWFKPDDIENIIVTQSTGRKYYNVFDKEGNVIDSYNAFTPLHAIDTAVNYNRNLSKDGLTAKLENETPPQQPLRMAPGESEFVVVNNTLGQRVSVAARDSATALSRALRNIPSWDSYNHQIRILSATPQAEEPAQEPSSPTQSQAGPGLNDPNEGMDSYLVSDPGDNSGGVRFRANSPEHAIERARAAFNLPADRELQARLENG